MRVISKQAGVRLTLTPEAERQLLGYSYPGNISVSCHNGQSVIGCSCSMLLSPG